MKQIINKHKTPIAVTVFGLVCAIGLAIAPGIMAGSETDRRAEKNSADIEKLLASVDISTADLQFQMNSISSDTLGKLSSLDNQIQTLNKATTRLHRKLQSIQKPSGAIQSSISELAKNSDARMINLEKAVVKLHRKQRQITNTENPEPAIVNAAENNAIETRLAKLEATIKDLQEYQAEQKQNVSPGDSQTTANTIADTSSGTDSIHNGQQEYDWRITSLERTVRQFVLNQKLMDTAGSTRLETAIRKDVETDLQIKSLQRSLADLEMRLDGMESTNRQSKNVVDRRYDPVVDQLFEIRSTVNSLLNEISR